MQETAKINGIDMPIREALELLPEPSDTLVCELEYRYSDGRITRKKITESKGLKSMEALLSCAPYPAYWDENWDIDRIHVPGCVITLIIPGREYPEP